MALLFSRFKCVQWRKVKKRQESSMIHSATTQFTAGSDFRLIMKLSYGRIDHLCENRDHYRPDLLGFVDQKGMTWGNNLTEHNIADNCVRHAPRSTCYTLVLGEQTAQVIYDKTGVINDPLGQTHNLASSEHCFLLFFALLDLKSREGRTDMCKNSDHYRPWLWVGRVDRFERKKYPEQMWT